MPRGDGTGPEGAEYVAQNRLRGMGNSARGRKGMARCREETTRQLVAGTHCPAAGDRQVHRRQGRV